MIRRCKMRVINFLDIYCALLEFSSDVQISYLTKQELIKNSNFPLKQDDDFDKKEALVKDKLIHLSENAICLIVINENERDALVKYKRPLDALESIEGIHVQELKCFNKKLGAVMAGLGQYGKNQLIYNPIFGFNIYISMFLIYNDVNNLPVREAPNYNILSQCNGCNLCEINCPAKAIHIEENGPHWLDMEACRNFYMYGNHPLIPSVKSGINQFLGNKYTEEELLEITDEDSFKKFFGFADREAIVKHNGKTYQLCLDHCKECMNQIPCRKKLHTYNKNEIHMEEIK